MSAPLPPRPASALASGPGAAPFKAANVPLALKEQPIWLTWSFVPQPAGKPRKVPYYDDGKPRRGKQGSELDRSRLVTFDKVRSWLEGGLRAGLGVALLPDCGLVALDFDDVVVDGVVDPRVLKLVEGTYAEFSPSRRGVRAFFEGRLHSRKDLTPDTSALKGADFFKIEVFGDSGFVTITGQILPEHRRAGWRDIAPLSDAVIAMYEARWGKTGGRHGQAVHSNSFAPTPKLGMTIEQASDALSFLDPDCPYHEWTGVLASLHHEFDGSEEAFAIASAWSGAGLKAVTEDVLWRKWQSFGRYTGRPRTMASVLAAVRDRLQALSPGQIVEELRHLTEEEVLRKLGRMTEHLAEPDAETVVVEASRHTGVPAGLLREARRRWESANDRGFEPPPDTRRRIDLKREDLTRLAHEVEQEILAQAEEGEYLVFGSMPAHVTNKPLPYTHLVDDVDGAAPSVTHIEPLDVVDARGLAERAVVFEVLGRTGRKPVGVPMQLIDILLKKKVHAAPVVKGLVRHPVVLPGGRIVCRHGLDAASGLFLTETFKSDLRPYSQPEAAQALQRLRHLVLEGFEFATPLDADVALAALFTGVQRRVMMAAPGILLFASAQASGKTTLARYIYVILTGEDMPATAFPVGDEAEMRKCLLSMLIRSPAMVCFDNVPDGFTFRSPALAAAMTSPLLHQRVLGETREVECLTNVLFAVTGNNVTLGADEVTRFLVSKLEPACARPEERSFKSPDVLARALRIRAQVLQEVVGIIAGCLAASERNECKPPSRFPEWDRLVRQPLMWAGGQDVADVFRHNAHESEELRAHRLLVNALLNIFGNEDFYAAQVSEACSTWGSDAAEWGMQLRMALESLAAKDVNSARSVGRVLGGKTDRPVPVQQGEVEGLARIRSRQTREGKLLYRIEVMSGV